MSEPADPTTRSPRAVERTLRRRARALGQNARAQRPEAGGTAHSGPQADAVRDEGERIAKRIARAGVCSRREAERLIALGKVRVDNRVITSPALDVRADQHVTVNGKPLPPAEPSRLFRLHKPRGVVTTAVDPEGRVTVYDLLPPDLPRLMPVGRLDINSEGLLLLTNDGELKRRLELPSTGWTRRYKVRAFGEITDDALARLKGGITVEGIAYGPIDARLDKMQGSNAWITMGLREGKNREVRRVLEHLGLTVNRLIRLAYGPFQLGALPKRSVEEVPRKVLNDQLGLGLEPPRTRRRTRAGETPALPTAPSAPVADA